jgi:hypothetical protein
MSLNAESTSAKGHKGTQAGAPPQVTLGQSRKLSRLNGMSVLPSTADAIGSLRHFRFAPGGDIGRLFDHLVSAAK